MPFKLEPEAHEYIMEYYELVKLFENKMLMGTATMADFEDAISALKNSIAINFSLLKITHPN